MRNATDCPVCQNRFGGTCSEQQISGRDGLMFTCDICGTFSISREALVDYFPPAKESLGSIQSAALSHALRRNTEGSTIPFITTDWMERFLVAPKLPTPSEQATNIVRVIGDYVADSGCPLPQTALGFCAQIGARNPDAALKLLRELVSRGMVTGLDVGTNTSRWATVDVDLTLDGWRLYDEQKSGRSAGKFGFVALKFGDPTLDPFLQEVIKPAVKEVGHDLIDLRDVAQAGVIDNIMRMTIRDAAFVLVDLTHDNYGAYWEAGFAEGLGKPVIYLCQKAKFEQAKTHFDTNHCTTVMWETINPELFRKELVATLRNSLKLFETV